MKWPSIIAAVGGAFLIAWMVVTSPPNQPTASPSEPDAAVAAPKDRAYYQTGYTGSPARRELASDAAGRTGGTAVLAEKELQESAKEATKDLSLWSGSRSTSTMDGSESLVYSLTAEGDLSGWLRQSRPTLVVRCEENATEVYLVLGMAANPEYGLYNEHSVRVRWDEAAPRKERWSASTDGQGLFAPRPISFLRSMGKAERLRIEVTPFNSSPQVVEFQVAGFNEALSDIASACRWRV